MTLSEFENKLSQPFTNKKLLEQAFIHRSFINENPRTGLEHNERLEFLGDAILELATTEFLYAHYPNHNEGDLTAYRSALVNAITLGEVATSLNFNDLIKLSKGEAKDTSRARGSILADAYEAFLGALYLDQGYDAVKEFVSKTLLVKTDEVIRKGLYKDPKSFVQEKSQEEVGVTPVYKLIEEMGPDHDKRFKMAIYFDNKYIAEGEGKSKQEAESAAAKAALIVRGWIKE
jgi:ribonuclease-3